ncbi:MAG TPA: WecB/TagA/CpsF family glycosyltransferase [Phycisphaerae bacterium]|nr:WecB/TagA/CpsF family glycosyltransferase [Phycisphaerae bacterium]HPZ99088.1 WecB/TagA/CpsF family glycosyltransferase [Phycisphaerae bacterium]HQE28994.1 WecB/TagA/CpsF family glycosyltransferase [Phycisphaerae bacterium]
MSLLVGSGPVERVSNRSSAGALLELPELPPAIPFAGLSFRPVTRAELIGAMIAAAKRRLPMTVHYLNAHTFNLARQDAEYRSLLAQCDLLYADGISIVWAARLFGYAVPGRLTSADYFEEFCRACAAESLSVFLVGGAAGVAEVAAERLRRAVPGLRIAGTSHGYLSDAESARVVERIHDSGADVLIVGMSSPGQERWIRDYGSRTAVPVQWSVGALLDYFAGVEPRAPEWLRRCAGEWLYRFLVDPSRRWRRYVVGNARFAWWLAAALLSGDYQRAAGCGPCGVGSAKHMYVIGPGR